MENQKMSTEQKTNIKNSVGRMIFVGIAVLIQVYWIVLLFVRLNAYSVHISICTTILAILVTVNIYGRHTNSAIKLSWIILILASPIIGLCLYVLMGRRNSTRQMRERFEHIDDTLAEYYKQDEKVMEGLEAYNPRIANLSKYMWNASSYPTYDNTDVTYYPTACEGFEAQLVDLEKAEHFIFMEYHAIEEAQAFARLKDVLARKAAEGVEVRVIYDDIGSIGFINKDFIHRMESVGIQCRVFNAIIPVLNIFMNNRDHRKITVIDGKIGFSGGYNLADEYFDITHPFGQWKDTGLRMEGDAVRSLTTIFLEIWNFIKQTDTSYEKYLPYYYYEAKEPGYVTPYADSPLDEKRTGEDGYLNMISYATKEVWLTTPYLVITDEMGRALQNAAKRGVDVRIITPGIPDKKMIYRVTRSFYGTLAKNGVRIFEYTPGFIHAKQCISDGEVATCGTMNLDYRSLYLHFENNTLFTNKTAVQAMHDDFLATFAECTEVTDHYAMTQGGVMRFGNMLLRLLSPLM